MQLKEQLYPNAALGDKPSMLQAIHQKEHSIAIYQRDISSLKSDLSITQKQDIKFEASGETHEITSAIDSFFTENLPECLVLPKDIQRVVQQFDEVANASSYRLLLSTINTNMCRKFHTDVNDLRLLCTYIGPGTLWIAEESGDSRKKEKLPVDENQIQQAGTGDVIILKGALYPNGNPIMHRSPTIEESGEKRLLLRLDTDSFMNF